MTVAGVTVAGVTVAGVTAAAPARHDAAAAPATTPAPPCLGCGAPRTGPYCVACGQRARTGRLTVAGVAHQVVAELVSVDRGLLHTALALARDPGRVARDYAAGRTAPYAGPVRYFVLVAGAARLLALRIGFLGFMVAGFFEGWDAHGAAPAAAQRVARDLVTQYSVSLTALGVPLYAACTRLLFRRAQLNLAEHLVLALYTGAQLLGALILLAAVEWQLHQWRVRAPYIGAAFCVVAPLYQTWALARFTDSRWPAALWRMLLAGNVALFGWLGMLAALVAALGRAT